VSLSRSDYEFVQQLLVERAAIVINEGQEYLVRSRLEPVAKQAGLGHLSALIDALRREPYGALHWQVIEAMTTNETSFFRDGHPFETFRQAVLPEIMARKARDKSLRIWSAACSTGQEPYSLAMSMMEVSGLAGWKISIVATDLSRAMLAKAQQGRYSALDVGRGLPARMLTQHFERVDNGFQVKQQLRAMIEWKQLNLSEDWPVSAAFDIVFMRNVLIYFQRATGKRILHKVRKALHPRGYLFLGTTENTFGVSADFVTETHGKTMLYRPVTTATGAHGHF
jgi:chemotaxis protein methyltransferase CheR